MSASGKTLYVTSGISDWVSVVDLRANAVTDNIVVGTCPGRFLLIHGGQELWVSIQRGTRQTMGRLAA
jgi:YVTN family beta-propeller protein